MMCCYLFIDILWTSDSDFKILKIFVEFFIVFWRQFLAFFGM